MALRSTAGADLTAGVADDSSATFLSSVSCAFTGAAFATGALSTVVADTTSGFFPVSSAFVGFALAGALDWTVEGAAVSKFLDGLDAGTDWALPFFCTPLRADCFKGALTAADTAALSFGGDIFESPLALAALLSTPSSVVFAFFFLRFRFVFFWPSAG
jgi:hypothetical protein